MSNQRYDPLYLSKFNKFVKANLKVYEKKPPPPSPFKHKDYSEIVDTEKLLNKLPKINKDKLMTKKTPLTLKNKPIVETPKPDDKLEVIVDTIETTLTPAEVLKRKPYKLKFAQGTEKDIYLKIMCLLRFLKEREIINMSQDLYDDFKKAQLQKNDTQNISTIFNIIIDGFQKEGIFDMTEEEYKKCPQFIKDLLQNG